MQPTFDEVLRISAIVLAGAFARRIITAPTPEKVPRYVISSIFHWPTSGWRISVCASVSGSSEMTEPSRGALE